jgi:hypothetical protein
MVLSGGWEHEAKKAAGSTPRRENQLPTTFNQGDCQMVARTVPQKSFYAHLHHESGILGQHAGKVLWFSYEDGRIVEVTSYAGLTVLGEVDLADTQALMDELHGGAAAIACSREEGVQ